MYKSFFKRIFDIVLSGSALIILFPLFILVSIMVEVKLGSPIIFKQVRPGKNGKHFTMFKFRTMTNKKNVLGELLSDSERLTKFGKFLRSTSLDELPELFNIFCGTMSFVGPRPQLIKDELFMTVEQKKRHTVKPGLTGNAQINGRNGITWEEKFDLDLIYIKNITFTNDIKIILKTFLKVFKRDGISMQGMDTGLDLGDYLLKNHKITQQHYDKILQSLEEV